MALTTFLTVAFLLFVFLFFIWKSSDYVNALIKILFFLMMVWSAVELGIRLGLVIKV